MKKKLSSADKQFIRENSTKMSLGAIGNRVGFIPQTILAFCQREGLPTRPKTRFTDKHKAFIEANLDKLTINEMAARVGFSRSTVSFYLKSIGKKSLYIRTVKAPAALRKKQKAKKDPVDTQELIRQKYLELGCKSITEAFSKFGKDEFLKMAKEQ